jgi:hypothetical protein
MDPIIITDFALGQLSKRYAGRVDGVRAKGAEEITGFVMRRDGGVSRRRGSIFVRNGVGITPATDRLYDAAGTPAFLVYKYDGSRWLTFIDGTAQKGYEIAGTSTYSITNSSLDEGIRLDGFTYYDPETEKSYLHLWTDNFAWDFTIGSQVITEASLAEPSCLFQNRFIGIERDSGYVYMSKELKFLEFENDENETRPLTLVADFAGIETPKWLVGRKGVYVGTDEGEWELYSSYPFFSEELGGLMARRISDVGTQQAVYFGPGLAMRDLSNILLVTPGPEGRYNVGSVNDRIDNKMAVNMAVNDFGTHQYLHVLDVEGDLYTYIQAPQQQISGWVKMAEDVGWAMAFNKELYVAIERGSDYSVEVFPLDELTHPGSRSFRQHAMFEANDAHGDRGGYAILEASQVTNDEFPPSTSLLVYTIDLTNEHSTLAGSMTSDASGDFADSLAGLQSLTGYVSGEQYLYAHEKDVYPAGTILSLPITPLIGNYAQIGCVVLQVEKSTGAKVRVSATDPDGNDVYGAWEEKTTSAPQSGPWYFRCDAPHGSEARIEVATVDHRPLNIHQVKVELEQEGGQ